MYSPTTRLLTVLALLQAHRQMTGAEIARRLEVDGRTVRRYITMLQDMGIPVVAERGPHGAYHLERGSKMPPLMFTDKEAVALTLGLMMMREFPFPVEAATIEGALAKTERVLPEKLLDQVRSLQEAITLNNVMASGEPFAPPPDSELVASLSVAIHNQRRVQLRYRTWTGDETERGYDPYGIVFYAGYWYTAGYCHLRQGLRTFRLDRVVGHEVGDDTFERPATFDTLAQVLQSLATTPANKPMKILLKTGLERARAAMPATTGILEETEQGVVLTPAAPHVSWMADLLLSFDFPVVILESDDLREEMRRLAARSLQIAEAQSD